GSQNRHPRFANSIDERLDPPIKLVVADHPGVVSEMIEQIDHQLALAAKTEISALINVSRVDQNCVWILPAPSPNLSNTAGQTSQITGSIIIDGRQNVTMEIGCVQDRNGNGIAIEELRGADKRRRATNDPRLSHPSEEIATAAGLHCQIVSEKERARQFIPAPIQSDRINPI